MIIKNLDSKNSLNLITRVASLALSFELLYSFYIFPNSLFPLFKDGSSLNNISHNFFFTETIFYIYYFSIIIIGLIVAAGIKIRVLSLVLFIFYGHFFKLNPSLTWGFGALFCYIFLGSTIPL